MQQSHGQPVPAAAPHRRLLAAADPARSRAAHLVLARCPVRHDPSLPDQSRRTGHRDRRGRHHRAAHRLPVPGWLCRSRRPRRQAAAVAHGAAGPRTNSSAQPQTPLRASPMPRLSMSRCCCSAVSRNGFACSGELSGLVADVRFCPSLIGEGVIGAKVRAVRCVGGAR
jgi:hypothetical protein